VIGITIWFLNAGRSQNRSYQARSRPDYSLPWHYGLFMTSAV
jgi:hypothetical protein